MTLCMCVGASQVKIFINPDFHPDAPSSEKVVRGVLISDIQVFKCRLSLRLTNIPIHELALTILLRLFRHSAAA